MWKDAWLGDDGTGKLITPWRHFEVDAKVSLLIDETNRYWRTDILHEAFLPIDVSRILRIPVSRMPREDTGVWIRSPDGFFRVKEAYQLAMQQKNEASSSEGPDPIWRHLWNLNVPPKVKEFNWRAMGNHTHLFKPCQEKGTYLSPMPQMWRK